MSPVRVSFLAGVGGEWIVEDVRAVIGATLPGATSLARIEGEAFTARPDAVWQLDGVRSFHRYLTTAEREQLVARQNEIGRPADRCAVLIPIRKTDAWWALAQDERRAIFEERSKHVGIGMEYLPAIARRLYHSREIGGPFDFLTWFEHAPENRAAFDQLLARLRETPEWQWIDREVEIRCRRA